MADDKIQSELPADGEVAPPTRDRDQSAYSTEVAAEKADRAEFPQTPGTRSNTDPAESLITRDNMKGPVPREGSS